MTQVKISAVIITFNEEKNIGRCIDSLVPVADEFIIVDGFSTDRTAEIVHSKGLTVTQRKWEGYSNSKNYANGLSSGDYILSIDADEELSPMLTESIKKVKHNPTADVYELTRITNYCGQWIHHSGWYPEYKIRIFRRGLAEWKGTIHEELIFKNRPRLARLKGDLNHYSYSTLEEHIKKTSLYAALAAQRDVESGKRYNLIIHGLIKPPYMFIRKYFIQLGFLDGFYGFVIAALSSFERFLRYVSYRQLTRSSGTERKK